MVFIIGKIFKKLLTFLCICDKFSIHTKCIWRCRMINSIVNRHGRLTPYTETEINIIRSAVKLFLENGYTKTTFKMIEADSGVKIGNITYYFHSKEDLFKVLVEELMESHISVIDDVYNDVKDNVYAYAMEVTAQIALCENDKNAWDLYYSAYSLPHTFDHIKLWAEEKNYNLFKDDLPGWSEHDFRNIEVVASGIEFAALKTLCDRSFTLDKKVSVILDSLLMLYEVSKEKRTEVIDKILKTDYEKMAKDMFESFVKRLDGVDKPKE